MRARFTAADRTIVALAVPAFFALISEPLMLLADTAIVGRLGVAPLAGLAAASSVLTTVVGLCVFLAYATTASVGRLQGAGHDDEALNAGISGLWLATVLGAVTGVGLFVFASPAAAALTDSPESADQAVTYLQIAALAGPAMLISLAATGSLRGLLDVRTPLIVTVAANVLNAGLSVWFVHGLDGGVAGAAWGTVIAQWVGAVALTWRLLAPSRHLGASLRPHLGAIWSSARSGGPLFVRTVTLRAALLIATAVAARLGDVPLAAHQIATSLVTLIAFGLDAIAIAGQALTGRSLGAGDAERTRALTRRMIGWGVATGVMAGGLLAAGAPWIGPLFVADPEVHRVLVPALLVVALIQPISGVVFVLDGVLIGAGDGRYLAWAGLITLIVYAPVAIAVGLTGAGLTALWLAYGVFQLTRFVTLWLRQRGDHWLRPTPRDLRS